MKAIIFYFVVLSFIGLSAQQNEVGAVKQTITTFFEGFHNQDSLVMKSTIGEKPVLQTIGADKSGAAVLRSDDFNELIKKIVSIPDSVDYQERITSFKIRIDGAMANAWTPYEFWINNQFSHCGVNSFQLFKSETGWKIIYLIDTRRKESCVD